MASIIINDNAPVFTNVIERTSFSNTQISQPSLGVSINSILPFRIRFSKIGIIGFSETNVPPIGIAIIGFSNYIL
jgi:hypothetical protein